jgi:hypothetical protein
VKTSSKRGARSQRFTVARATVRGKCPATIPTAISRTEIATRNADDRNYAALLPFTGQRWSHLVQCHNSVVLAPFIVVSCFTVATPPHDGHGGGGVGLMELSGIERADPTTRCSAVVPNCSPAWILIVSNRLPCGRVRGPGRHVLAAQLSPTVPPQASWHRAMEAPIRRLPDERRHRSRRAVRPASS